jgi:DNA-binding response OmpR family regulator
MVSDAKVPRPCVLIVEDEPEIVEVISSLLTREGYQVMSADRISRAQKMLTNQKFCAVTVDIRLAQGSGEQVISNMRSDHKGFNFRTPVLVISAFITPDLVAKIGPQIQGALAKPFNNDELVAKIKRLCPGVAAAK